MKLAVCSIQKNRGPWLLEWIVFHHLSGFTDFIIYLHDCDDESPYIIERLRRVFSIQCFEIRESGFGIQLRCFQHAYETFSKDYDWMAFIDGDEFLFTPQGCHIASALARYHDIPASALAVYWRSFGASGHVAEPPGLVTQNYRYRAEDGFIGNLHIKSLVRCDGSMRIATNSHYFETKLGTIDEKLNHITGGFDARHIPSWEFFCINHYSTQSREFYEKIKKDSGAADAGPGVIRPESWWDEYNRNEIFDCSLEHLNGHLEENIRKTCAATDIPFARLGGLPAHLRKTPHL